MLFHNKNRKKINNHKEVVELHYFNIHFKTGKLLRLYILHSCGVLFYLITMQENERELHKETLL